MFRPFALERYFAAHEFSSRFLLCTSDCESVHIDEVLALEPGARDALGSTWLGYTESRGSPALREDIARLYGGMDREDILVCSGAEEAILDFFLATIHPGRQVIVTEPCYQSLKEIPLSLGAIVHPWPVERTDGRWVIDPDRLEEILETVRAGEGSPGAGGSKVSGDGREPPIVVLNTPHNPTGAHARAADFDRIIAACARHDAILLCDEVYRYLEFDPADRLPAACELYEHAVSLSVLSKAWGLAGLRIGWLSSKRRDILDAVATVKDYNSICASAPSETLAGIAIRHREFFTGRCREICMRNLGLFNDFFDRKKDLFDWIPPVAGSVAFTRIRGERGTRQWAGADGKPDAAVLAERLLQDTGVLILPGATYGTEAASFRVGLGRHQAAQALGQLDAWLDSTLSG